MKVFLSGVMQGARLDDQIDDQDYRAQITAVIKQHHPRVEVVDPFQLHPNSVSYDDDTARETFQSLVTMAGTADLVIVYLPRPSLGSAMEMWEAHRNDVPIIAVTPFVHQWAVKHIAEAIVPDLPTLFSGIESGRFAALSTPITH